MNYTNENAKRKFENYCMDKISDLGTIVLQIEEEKKELDILFVQDIRNFGNCAVVYHDDKTYAINQQKEVFDIFMIDYVELLSRCEFDYISERTFEDIFNNWNDYSMNELMKDSKMSFKDTLKQAERDADAHNSTLYTKKGNELTK